jgi:hypothetical protein
VLAGLGALLLAPGAAQAMDCGLPGSTDPTMTSTPLDVTGSIPQSYNGDYVQIPFTVPANTTAIRVRYSYDQPDPNNPGQSMCGSGPNTLDMGVYSPKQAGETYWTSADSRGWSGSAVKDLAISTDGFTDDSTYNTSRKAYVSGYTTRAYRPGPIQAGAWAVELGMGWVDPSDTDGVQYHVQVQTTTDTTTWTHHPPPVNDSYDPTRVGNSNAGWYAGDLHVHGEMEPGNATRTQMFAAAFGAAPAGGGLDFVSQVDHNNNITEDTLRQYQDAYPSKLIIPGVEETTYRGHFMNTGSSSLADFRTTPIYAIDPNVSNDLAADATPVRTAMPPSQDFADIQAAGGYTEVNHPTIFQTAPSACRGCAWNYTDQETDFSKVNAIEIQNGPPQIGSAFNPFTSTAIDYYNHALDSGAHIAAVGGSDDHQGAGGSGVTYSPVGTPATMVDASKLSEQAVINAIKGAHTYVKLYGVSSPTIDLTAKAPGAGTAGIGDSVSGPSATFTATVSGAASTGRPGTVALVELKNGTATKAVPVTGNSFTKTFNATGSGRYSIEVTRTVGSANYIEDYSSPIWFTSSDFDFSKPVIDAKKGTGKVVVKVPDAGKLSMKGKGTKTSKATAEKAGKVSLPVKLTGDSKKKLNKQGKLKLKLSVTYTPTGGAAYSQKTSITLKKK